LLSVQERVVKRVVVFGLLISLFASQSAQAADYIPPPLYPSELYAPDPALEMDFGIRYWYSTGKTQKTLYDGTGDLQLSRLTWRDQDGHSGEGYFKIAQLGVFLKGYIGAGIFSGGKLQDEDFVSPDLAVYSSTDSQAKDGRFEYASIDLGYYVINTPGGKLGGFVGYHYDRDRMSAFGCTQTATNPDICVPSIPGSVKVLTQEYKWHSLRLGVAGEISPLPNLKLSAEAAWLPRVTVDGNDWHWLRIGTDFSGPTPETGRGTGLQVEGLVSYMFANNVTLGIGGRYWHTEIPNGTAHFEESTLSGGPQVEKIKSDRYGVFVQLGVQY
jgi:outer membrane protease